MNIKKLAVVVPLATTDSILDVDVEHYEELGLTITNNGPNAFDAFQIRAVMHASGEEVTLATLAADFATPLFPLRRAVGTPVTLANAATAALFLSVAGIKRIRLYASAATGAGTADIYGQAR